MVENGGLNWMIPFIPFIFIESDIEILHLEENPSFQSKNSPISLSCHFFQNGDFFLGPEAGKKITLHFEHPGKKQTSQRIVFF